VAVQNVTRIYRADHGADVVALDDVSLTVEEGEVRGLLGPNGAGKTTLVKILCTILLPTRGSVTINGLDVVHHARRVRREIGIVIGGERGLYWRLTGRQNLEFWAALYHVPAAEVRPTVNRLLERVRLADRAYDPFEAYSRGMKQRLHLARGLIGNPRVLFLDEPTSGMDPVAAHEFRSLIGELRSEGRTVLLTTHDMAEAEAVCDRVTLIDHGRVLAVETPASLARLVSEHERIDFTWVDDEVLADICTITGVTVAPYPGPVGSYRIEVAEAAIVPIVLGRLVQAGVTSIRTSRPSLEEVYLHLIGRPPLTGTRIKPSDTQSSD
jgi:ABC-2 type transport system ATP-binding protein